jgi:hypothetical protein
VKNQIEDISNYLGRALFIVLFFLMIAAFSDRSVQKSNDGLQSKFVSEWQANPPKAIVADAGQLPLFQKNWISSVNKLNRHLLNTSLKQSAEDRRIAQRIISLRQTELRIKPLSICRFYFHLFPAVADDVPILS